MPANLLSNHRSYRLAAWAILTVGLLVRIFALWHFSENLTDDRDSYLRIATHLAQGNGFSSTGTEPTAFRPPLYPCVLAVGIKLSQSVDFVSAARWVGALNLAFGLFTVALVMALAREHFDERTAQIAGWCVAANPFLIYQTTLPMTETLFGFLVVGLLRSLSKPQQTLRQRCETGIWLGLSSLCRPTIWAFVGLGMIISLINRASRLRWRQSLKSQFPTLLTTALFLAPWTIRNAQVYGTFLPLTTHGGYTLLLGNNPVFYREVVEKSWRTTWKGESLARWQQSIDRQYPAAYPSAEAELSRNSSMSRLAIENILDQPGMFLRSCVVRFLRFWNPVPLTSDDTQPAKWEQAVLLGFATLLFLGLLLSCRDPLRRNSFSRSAWILIAATTALHLIYWSNLRMRVPLEPVIGILSVRGWLTLLPIHRENQEIVSPDEKT